MNAVRVELGAACMPHIHGIFDVAMHQTNSNLTVNRARQLLSDALGATAVVKTKMGSDAKIVATSARIVPHERKMFNQIPLDTIRLIFQFLSFTSRLACCNTMSRTLTPLAHFALKRMAIVILLPCIAKCEQNGELTLMQTKSNGWTHTDDMQLDHTWQSIMRIIPGCCCRALLTAHVPIQFLCKYNTKHNQSQYCYQNGLPLISLKYAERFILHISPQMVAGLTVQMRLHTELCIIGVACHLCQIVGRLLHSMRMKTQLVWQDVLHIAFVLFDQDIEQAAIHVQYHRKLALKRKLLNN
mgnify:CR=1 FL=1